MSTGTTVQSLERAIDLLKLISSEHKSGARLSALVAASGLPQPTVHRLLKQMVQGGLVMQDAQRSYRLGHFAYELGLVASASFNLRDQCAPFLQTISADTADTAFLVVRSGLQALCVDRRSGSFPIQVLTMEVGKRRPLGIGGGGLTLLSFLRDEEATEVLDRIEPQLATYGGLSRAILLDMVQTTRRQGYARMVDYAVPGVTSLGLPVRDRGGMVLGAVSVSAMSTRMHPRMDQVLQIMQREVLALQRVL